MLGLQQSDGRLAGPRPTKHEQMTRLREDGLARFGIAPASCEPICRIVRRRSPRDFGNGAQCLVDRLQYFPDCRWQLGGALAVPDQHGRIAVSLSLAGLENRAGPV